MAEKRPRDLQYLSLRIEALLKRQRWEDCQETCRTALEVDPHNALAHLGLARSALHLEQPEAAVEHALAATGFQYGNPRGHFLLGAALVALRQWDAAARALGIATQLAPHFYPAWHYLATALRGRGMTDAADGAVLKMKLLRHEHSQAARERTERRRRASAQPPARATCRRIRSSSSSPACPAAARA